MNWLDRILGIEPLPEPESPTREALEKARLRRLEKERRKDEFRSRWENMR